MQRSCNLCRTYAQRAWSEHEVHRFHGFKYIWSFHTRFNKQAFGEFEVVHIKYDHECKILIIIKPSNGLSSPLKRILLQLVFSVTDVVMALQVLSIIYLTSSSQNAYRTLINAFLKARMFEYVVLHVGGGGNPRNTTDMPHPYIQILNRAIELTSEWFATVLFRPQSVM